MEPTRFLSSAPSIQCFTSEWYSKLPSVIFLMTILVVVFPILLLINLHRIRPRKGANVFVSENYRFLVDMYKKSVFWCEAIHVLKRASLISSNGLILATGSESQAKYFVSVVILVVSLLVDITVMPYKVPTLNKSSLLWNCIVLLCLLADGLVFKSSYISEQDMQLRWLLLLSAHRASESTRFGRDSFLSKKDYF